MEYGGTPMPAHPRCDGRPHRGHAGTSVLHARASFRTRDQIATAEIASELACARSHLMVDARPSAPLPPYLTSNLDAPGAAGRWRRHGRCEPGWWRRGNSVAAGCKARQPCSRQPARRGPLGLGRAERRRRDRADVGGAHRVRVNVLRTTHSACCAMSNADTWCGEPSQPAIVELLLGAQVSPVLYRATGLIRYVRYSPRAWSYQADPTLVDCNGQNALKIAVELCQARIRRIARRSPAGNAGRDHVIRLLCDAMGADHRPDPPRGIRERSSDGAPPDSAGPGHARGASREGSRGSGRRVRGEGSGRRLSLSEDPPEAAPAGEGSPGPSVLDRQVSW
eukprot:1249528-Rhodomonas_salina.2